VPRTRDVAIDESRARWGLRALSFPRLPFRFSDMAVGLLAAGGGLAILINALALQPGPHPAPLFVTKPLKVSAEPAGVTGAVAALPRPRPPELESARIAPPVARPKGELVADIQRELARRGFYDGAADGVHGPKTDAAIRDFEQMAGLKSGEPTEALLKAITRSSFRATAVKRTDSIGDLLGSSKQQITAIQRALADFGFGQIKPSGVVDAETRAAIEKFERERRLPVTGNVSERVVRELAAMTGRPLN
jgi:peptidoglycan hydrolase-like protein with peptidoglycan-binding domain